MFPEDAALVTYEDKKITLQFIFAVITAVVLIIGVFVWFTLPGETINSNKKTLFSFQLVFTLLKKRKIIFHSLMILSAYSAYKLTGVFGIYARDVWSFSLENATYFAVMIQFLRPIIVILIGSVADHFSPSKVMIPCFICILFSSLTIGLGGSETNYFMIYFYLFILIALGTYSLRGLYFALIEEIKAPIQVTGTLVGIISVIGFTPDIFMSLLIGYMLGNDPTVLEYQKLFTLFTLFPLLGVVFAYLFKKTDIIWE